MGHCNFNGSFGVKRKINLTLVIHFWAMKWFFALSIGKLPDNCRNYLKILPEKGQLGSSAG